MTFNLSPFKLDIDELINEFVEGGGMSLGEMQRVWLTRKFTYIFGASPSVKLALFMQPLYAHSIVRSKVMKLFLSSLNATALSKLDYSRPRFYDPSTCLVVM